LERGCVEDQPQQMAVRKHLRLTLRAQPRSANQDSAQLAANAGRTTVEIEAKPKPHRGER